MSKENLNDFYEMNRFNRKLRERVDAYEPELSDSLWDRIEHDLNHREGKSKRVLWLVYVLSGMLLLSSAGIFYLLKENKKLADASQVNPTAPDTEKPAMTLTIPEVEIRRDAGSAPESTTPASQGNPVSPESTNADYPALGGAPGNIPPATPSHETYENLIPNPSSPQENPSGISPEYTNPQPRLLEGSELLIPQEIILTEGEEAELPSGIRAKKIQPIATAGVQPASWPLKEVYRGRMGVNPRVMPYAGVSVEAGSSRQLLSNSDSLHRFGFEHPAWYSSKGLNFGVKFRNGFFVETGFHSSVTAVNNWWDTVFFKRYDTVPVLQATRNIVPGNHHNQSKQYWLDIPVQLGYQKYLSSRFSLTGRTGLTYSMINTYNGVEPDIFLRRFASAGTWNPKPFRNFWTWNLGAGIGYNLTRRLMLNLEANYRRGLTTMNNVNEINYPNRKLEAISGRLGITYSLY